MRCLGRWCDGPSGAAPHPISGACACRSGTYVIRCRCGYRRMRHRAATLARQRNARDACGAEGARGEPAILRLSDTPTEISGKHLHSHQRPSTCVRITTAATPANARRGQKRWRALRRPSSLIVRRNIPPNHHTNTTPAIVDSFAQPSPLHVAPRRSAKVPVSSTCRQHRSHQRSWCACRRRGSQPCPQSRTEQQWLREDCSRPARSCSRR